jgi:GntR family transcriptional regulator
MVARSGLIEVALDRRIPVPLYYQLQQQLRQAILDGTIAPGASLPPEPDLAVSAGVSRFTVRQAVEQLVREGLVRRERGRGTFVADASDSVASVKGFQFTHILDRLQEDLAIRVLYSRMVSSPDTMRQLLPPGASGSVHEIARVHEARQKPIAVEVMHVPISLVPETDQLDLQASRLQPILEQQFGLRVSHAEESLRSVNVSGDAANWLGLSNGAAAFRIERRSWAGTSLMEMSSITIPGQLGLSRILDSSAQFTTF